MREILLTKGYVAIVDDEDFEWLSQRRWHALISRRGAYAARSEGGRSGKRYVYMHRLIIGAVPGVGVDHVNGDGLDNRRANLRLASAAENGWNAGPRMANRKYGRFKGAWYLVATGRWQARISVRGKLIHIGHFDTELEAALAYDAAAREYHGAFARLNFPHAA